jgi:metal-sulfur cluster biosynthetic enzyme
MFIQTETTPDPSRLRFLPGQQVLAEGRLEIGGEAEAANSPLAARLLAIPEVVALSFGVDDIVVTKNGGEWQHLKPAILGAIMEHFLSGAPVVREPPPGAGRSGGAGEAAGGDVGAADTIRAALHQVIDPELGYNIVDLGLVYDVAVEAGVAHVTMTTTTPGCPATNYLKDGARQCALGIGGIEDAEVALTYEPRWSPEMMSAAAKAHFGIDR